MTGDPVLDTPDEEVLEIVEQAAATGNARAATILRNMLEERAKAGEIGLLSRIQATPYLDSHSGGRQA